MGEIVLNSLMLRMLPPCPGIRAVGFFIGLLLFSRGCQPALSSKAPAHPSNPDVTLALLGDVMLGRGVRPSAQTFSYLVPFLSSADLAMANLESPLTTAAPITTSAYVLCASPDRVSYLAAAGLDLVTLANNHREDCGQQGAQETRSIVEGAGLDFVDSQAVYRTINNVQLAFLAFDATRGLDAQAASAAVHSAHEAGAVVIVSIHWGAEYQSGPSTYQRRLAAQLSEAGAALLWGHHPHVLQPSVWIGDGRTLVFYSLGNALFDQQGLSSTRQSAVVLVTMDSQGVKEFRVVPFAIDVLHSRITEPGETERQTIMQYFPASH